MSDHDRLAAIEERLAAIERRLGTETSAASTTTPLAMPSAAAGFSPPEAGAPPTTGGPKTAAYQEADPPSSLRIDDSLRGPGSPASAPPPTLESRIGAHWLNRVGIAAVLIGAAFFLK